MPVQAMTDQEIFDTVARHLIKQGRPALNEHGDQCLYRGANGTMCAFGVLIPDECYSSNMEGRSAEHIIPGGIEALCGDRAINGVEGFECLAPFLPNLMLIHKLQRLHDDWGLGAYDPSDPDYSIALLKGSLRKVAESHGLSTAVVEG